MEAETVGEITRIEPTFLTGNPEAVKKMPWLFYDADQSMLLRSKTSLIVGKLPKYLTRR